MAVFEIRCASDAALVDAIGPWRDDALAEVFRRHSGSVFAVARRVRDALGVLSDAERHAVGDPEGTVKRRMRSGLLRLRQHLTRAGVDLA